MLSDALAVGAYFMFNGLNPCSNGICSLIYIDGKYEPLPFCLNPCSNGICSLITQQTEPNVPQGMS